MKWGKLAYLYSEKRVARSRISISGSETVVQSLVAMRENDMNQVTVMIWLLGHVLLCCVST